MCAYNSSYLLYKCSHFSLNHAYGRISLCVWNFMQPMVLFKASKMLWYCPVVQSWESKVRDSDLQKRVGLRCPNPKNQKKRNNGKNISSWWVSTNPCEKDAPVKWDHFPPVWGENRQYLEPPARFNILYLQDQIEAFQNKTCQLDPIRWYSGLPAPTYTPKTNPYKFPSPRKRSSPDKSQSEQFVTPERHSTYTPWN